MNDTDGDLYRLRPTLAKIGKRYYWAVWRFTTPDEGQLPDFLLVREVDGFADSREDATTAVVDAMDAIDPTLGPRYVAETRRRSGWGWSSKYGRTTREHPDRSPSWVAAFHADGGQARALYKHHYVKQKVSDATHARPDLGVVWTFNTSSEDQRNWGWRSHRITKVTAKRVFIHDEGSRYAARARLSALEQASVGTLPDGAPGGTTTWGCLPAPAGPDKSQIAVRTLWSRVGGAHRRLRYRLEQSFGLACA